MVQARKLILGINAKRFLRFTAQVLMAFVWLATLIGFQVLYAWPKVVSLFIFCAGLLAGWAFRHKKVFEMIGVFVGFLGFVISIGRITPSNDRKWATEFSVLPRIKIADQQVTIQGFRQFKWSGPQDFDPAWVTRSFDLRKLQSLDLIIEPFKDSELLAHTMLRFNFDEDNSLIVSVEARREKNETYSLIAGALRQFELIYLFGDEEDLVTLRAVHRGTRLYAYPVKAEKKFIRDLFLDLASGANALHAEPKFYQSIRDNCTTTLVKHVDRRLDEPIGLRYETLFPALTGKLLYDMDFMDTTLSYEEAKKHFRIDEIIRERNNNRNNVEESEQRPISNREQDK